MEFLFTGVELDVDAPVLDDVDSIDNSQGSDEAITIIPDSEREITEVSYLILYLSNIF